MNDDAFERLGSDPDLGPLVDAHGRLSLDPADDLFARLIVSILRQQVSMASAAAIRERLFDRVEVTPTGILDADDAVLLDAGLSGAKVDYVRNVAKAFEENGFSQEYFADLDDEAVLEELTAIRGVGTWTGKMFLMFGLGREDVFPVEDLGIRKGMWALFDEDMTRTEMYDRAATWKPYRSYASLYLWRGYED